MNLVCDTRALVWYFTGDKRLPKKVRTLLEQGEQGKHLLIIPVIVLLEAVDIAEKKRVRFDIFELLDFIEAHPSFEVIGLDFPFIRELITQGQGLELHDRIIFVTGERYRAKIITKDSAIRRIYKEVIW